MMSGYWYAVWGATLLLWIECIFGKDIEGTPALIMFYGIVPVICLEYISGFCTVHRRLKRLTWKNFRYHVGWCNIGEKLPKQYKLGNCEQSHRSACHQFYPYQH